MSNNDKYILEGHEVVLEHDLLVWGKWFEDNKDKKKVAQIYITSDIWVSTVFLGIDHDFGGGARHPHPAYKPLIFETMIFGGKRDQYQMRCRTWQQAEKQHEVAVEIAKKAISPIWKYRYWITGITLLLVVIRLYSIS